MRATMQNGKVVRLAVHVDDFIADARNIIREADKHACTLVVENDDGSVRAIVHPHLSAE